MKKSANLAGYAINTEGSRGRVHSELPHAVLSPYQVDRIRIVNSSSFRRLGYKTQVFINNLGDHYRTRLTHTLEVAQIAKIIAYELMLNDDLAECIALAHDLGHAPFGHSGEDALNDAAAEFGGFDHNAQAVKILTNLEQRHIAFDGLNLTWETIEGVVKHNGPITPKNGSKKAATTIYEKVEKDFNMDLTEFPSMEAQVSSLADDIAYVNHDLEDGLRAGLISINDLQELTTIREILASVRKKHPNLTNERTISEVTRHLKQNMIEDLISETKRRLETLKVASIADVRGAGEWVVGFSVHMEQIKDEIKSFLFKRIYRNYKVNRVKMKACSVIDSMFKAFMSHPECMPSEWSSKAKALGNGAMAEAVIDYIAGMTDRYAIEEYKRLFEIS